MRRIVYDRRIQIARWVSEQIGYGPEGLKDSYAMGILEGDRVIAGVAFNHYTHPTICINAAALPGAFWVTREFRFQTFFYPFEYLHCERLTAYVAGKNAVSQRFIEKMGFVFEGRQERALAGDDLLVYRMFKEDCKWIKAEYSSRFRKAA